MDRSIYVYLDSSDYSVLSNPRIQTASTIHIRDRLLDWAKSGEVKFLFSGVHLSEMAPVESAYATSATARADLLTELCGRNALISFDRLLVLELGGIGGDRPDLGIVRTVNADWFPKIDDDIVPLVNWADAIKNIDDDVKHRGVNRHQRRAANRRLFKKGHPTQEAVILLEAFSGSIEFEKFLELYPMHPSNAEILWKYTLGIVKTEDANLAFVESLRDPKWMMRWFEKHHDQLTPIIQWLRGSSQGLTVAIKALTEKATEIFEMEERLGVESSRGVFSKNNWDQAQDHLAVSTASQMREKFIPGSHVEFTSDQFDASCPGFSCCLRSLHSSIRSAVGESARTPKDSDIVDAIHAMYAPYVDIFRADSFMSTYIIENAAKHGTIVVSKLNSLVEVIERQLSVMRSTI